MQKNNDIANYIENGFGFFSNYLSDNSDLAAVEKYIGELGKSFFGPKFSMFTPFDYPRDKLSKFYESLRYSLVLQKLAVNDEILKLVKSVGLNQPITMNANNIRMDEPTRDEVLFHWHQDITYLLGSKNSITLWIPLGKTDLTHGTIGVKKLYNKEILEFEVTSSNAAKRKTNMSPKDIVLVDDIDTSDEIVINSNRGDVVVFSQYLLHRSRKNSSQICRWTIQLRYSDLSEEGFIEAGLPIADRTTILNTSYYGKVNYSVSSGSSDKINSQTF